MVFSPVFTIRMCYICMTKSSLACGPGRRGVRPPAARRLSLFLRTSKARPETGWPRHHGLSVHPRSLCPSPTLRWLSLHHPAFHRSCAPLCSAFGPPCHTPAQPHGRPFCQVAQSGSCQASGSLHRASEHVKSLNDSKTRATPTVDHWVRVGSVRGRKSSNPCEVPGKGKQKYCIICTSKPPPGCE